MIQKKVPLISMYLYLRRDHGVISGVIHDMRAGRWACIASLDQLLLYLDDVIKEAQNMTDADADSNRRPELPEMTESFGRISANDMKRLELQVTGGEHKSLQGQIYPAEDEPGEPRPFASGLELLKRIHQLV